MMSLRVLLLSFCLLLSGLSAAEEAYWEYTFRPGDSIWKIAKTYTTSPNNWQKIKDFNKVASGQDLVMRPGARIKIPVSLLKAQPAHASIIALSGDVSIVRKDGQQSAATTASKLQSGDEIITGDNASVTLRFADGSELLLLANSRAQMDTLSAHGDNGMVDTRVRLKSGQLDTRVNKQRKDSRYEIITPAAVAAVRGTAFRISADGDIMRNEVTEGVVAVAAGNDAKTLDAGYGIVAQKDQPLPQPVKLLPAPELSKTFYITEYEQPVNWSALPGATAYRVQLAPTPAFKQLLFDRITQQNHTSISGLDNKTYALRVRGIDSQQLQGLDAAALLDVSILPAAAKLQARKTGSRIQFDWPADNTMKTTVIELARDAEFTDVVQRLQTDANHIASKELPAGQYYYRNKRIDARGVEGGYGDTGVISTEEDNIWPFFIGAGVIILLL